MDETVIQKAKGQILQHKTSDIFTAIKSQEAGFKLALPKDFDASRFTRIALTAVRNNPALQKCTKESLLASMMLSAQLGLEPNSPLQQAYIIPYGNKAEFQTGYKGLLKLAWNSGLVTLMDADKVHENDHFEYVKGFNPIFEHKPTIKGKAGEVIAYYAYAQIKGGGNALVVMSKDEVIEHAKKFSKSYNTKSSPWKSDFDSMAKKTVLIQLTKTLPQATTNEALMFTTAANVDSTVHSLHEDQIGKAVTIEEMADDTDYEVVDARVHESPIGAGFAHKDTKAQEVEVNKETGEVIEIGLRDKPVIKKLIADIKKQSGDAENVLKNLPDNATEDEAIEKLTAFKESLLLMAMPD